MPRTINIALNDEDVDKNAKKILKDMQKIRQECTAERLVKNKAEYTALARRLASCIKAEGKKFSDKAETLDGILKKEPLLWNYDPLQLRYWNGKTEAREFLSALSEIAITMFQPDNFARLFENNAEYHCLQALKLIENMEANPVSELPANAIAGEIAEARDSISKLVEKYAECGMIRVDLRTKNPATVASDLKNEGYETMPTDKMVTVLFDTTKKMQHFFKLAFGYKSLKECKEIIYARTKEGYALLEKNGKEKTVLGKKRFKRVKEDGEKIELRSNEGFAYLENGTVLHSRWFEKPLDKKQMETIKNISQKFKSATDWVLRLKAPLEQIANLDKDNATRAYNLGIAPSITLLKNIDDLKVNDLDRFASAYDTIKFTEGDNSTLWQILDTIDPEPASRVLSIMTECYEQCPELQKRLSTYQHNRTEHPTKESLLRSVLDFLLTTKAYGEQAKCQ